MKMNKKIVMPLAIILALVMIGSIIVLDTSEDSNAAVSGTSFKFDETTINYGTAYGSITVSDLQSVTAAVNGNTITLSGQLKYLTPTTTGNDSWACYAAMWDSTPPTDRHYGIAFTVSDLTSGNEIWINDGEHTVKTDNSKESCLLYLKDKLDDSATGTFTVSVKVSETTTIYTIDYTNLIKCTAVVNNATYKFFELSRAIDASDVGSAVKLLVNQDIESSNVFIKKSVTLDLNGKTYTISGGKKLWIGFTADSVPTPDVKTLTITDSSTNDAGKIILAGEWTNTVTNHGTVYVNGHVTMNKGTAQLGSSNTTPAQTTAMITVFSLNGMVGLTGNSGTTRLWTGDVQFGKDATLVDNLGAFLTVGGSGSLVTVADKGNILGSVTFSFPGHYGEDMEFAINAATTGQVTVNKDIPAFSNFGISYLKDIQFDVPTGSELILLKDVTTSKIDNEGTVTINGTVTNNGAIVNNGSINIVNNEANKARITQNGDASITSTLTSGGNFVIDAKWTQSSYADRAIVLKGGVFEKQNVTAKNKSDDKAFMTVYDNATNAVTVRNNVFTMERPNGIGVEAIGSGAVSFKDNKFISASSNAVEFCIFVAPGTISSSLTVEGTDISGVATFGIPEKGYAALVVWNPVSTESSAFTIGGLNASDVKIKTDISSIGVKRGSTDNNTILVVNDDLSFDYIAIANLNASTNQKCAKLVINEGKSLTVDGNLYNYGEIVNKGTITNKGTISNSGKIQFGEEELGIATATGSISLDKDGKIDASAGSKVIFKDNALYSGRYIEAKASSAWNATWNTTGEAYNIVITQGTIDLTAPIWENWSLTINSGTILNVLASIHVDGTVTNNGSMTIAGTASNALATVTLSDGNKIVNNGTITVDGYGVLDTSACNGTIGTEGVTGANGTLIVNANGVFKMGYATDVAEIPTGQFTGTMKVYTDGKLYGIINDVNAAGNVITTADEGSYVQVVSKSSSSARSVEYSLFGKGTVNDAAYTSGFFAKGDKLVVDKDATLTVTALKIGEGVKMSVAGNVSGATITMDKSGTIDIESTGVVNVTEINMVNTDANVKAIMIKQGGKISALVDGSTTGEGATVSKATLSNITGGSGGLNIIKGSVYINGTLATPDATGTITIPSGAGAVKISGSVEEGVTLNIEANASIIIPDNATLTFEEGSTFTYDDAATITYQNAASSIVYEKGAVVNNEVIEVETKENSEGTIEAIRIYLVSQDSRKLILSIDFVEVLPGKTFGDALNGVEIIPLKNYVSFEGWYNLAFNEKIRSTDAVGNNDITLTACFSEDKRTPVTPVIPEQPDVPSTDSSGTVDYALPAAFILLVVSIFALGYVILKKRN